MRTAVQIRELGILKIVENVVQITEERMSYKVQKNMESTLCVPTYITQIDGLYFIVDCYHNQVIFHENLEDPLAEWDVMISDLNKPHSLASDGRIYVIDDTDNNQLIIMKRVEGIKNSSVFVTTQKVTDVGNRPHYTVYHEESQIFYVWSSQSGEMYLFQPKENLDEVELKEVKSVPELSETYVRSFTIIGDSIYFVSGNNNVIEADLESFEVLSRWPVKPEIGGMVQLTKIQNCYYITVSTDSYGNAACATIIRMEELESLQTGEYEVIYDLFEATGTPYYMVQIGDKWYLTHHKGGTQIWRFDVVNDVISNIEEIY